MQPMATNQTLYFDRSGEYLQTQRDWRIFMRENNRSVLRLIEAKCTHDNVNSYCKATSQVVKRAECNRSCPHHATENKQRRCKYYGYIYKPTQNQVVLTLHTAHNINRIIFGKREKQAIAEACASFGITSEALRSKCRKTALVHARHFLIILFVFRYNHAIRPTTAYFRLNNSNFYHALYQLTAEYETSRRYRQQINQLLETLGVNPGKFIERLTYMRNRLQTAKQYAQ
jgi:hypothetical protein